MLPIEVRGKLFSISFTAQDQGIADVPLVSWMDIAMLPKIGPRKAVRLGRYFAKYRRNLNTDSWACLTNIYPRAYYAFYYMMLFWWADYCKCLPTLLDNPRPSLVVELLVRYFVEIDQLIDRPGGLARLENPSSLKLDAKVAAFQSELMRHIYSSNISPQARRDLCHVIWTYRQESLKALKEAFRNGRPINLAQVYNVNVITTGGLFRTWTEVLAILYSREASAQHAQNAAEVFFHLAMSVQIMDDMMDFPEDFFDEVPNIFHELLRIETEEIRLATDHIRAASWKNLDLAWAQQHLPKAYAAALALIDKHMSQAVNVSIDPDAVTDLCKMISRLLDHPVGV